MQTTILLILASMVIAIICDSLAWGKFTSRTFINAKSPSGANLEIRTHKQFEDTQIKQGQISEITRTLALTIISFVALLLFGEVDLRLAIQDNLLVQALCIIGLLYGFIYHLFVGPARLANTSQGTIQRYSKEGFREFLAPYLFKLISFLAVIFGILSVLIISVIVGIQEDFNQIFKSTSELISLLDSSMIDTTSLQLISMKLVSFGDWISLASQKYMVTSLLLLFFIIFVQSSFLNQVVFQASIDKYKFVFWIIALTSLSFSAIYLPVQYSTLYANTQTTLIEYIDTFQSRIVNSSTELSSLLSLEDFLLNHDVNWLILKLFSGYGNMAAAITIIGGIVIKKVFLSDVEASAVLSLLLPSKLFNYLNKYISQIGWEDIHRDK